MTPSPGMIPARSACLTQQGQLPPQRTLEQWAALKLAHRTDFVKCCFNAVVHRAQYQLRMHRTPLAADHQLSDLLVKRSAHSPHGMGLENAVSL